MMNAPREIKNILLNMLYKIIPRFAPKTLVFCGCFLSKHSLSINLQSIIYKDY